MTIPDAVRRWGAAAAATLALALFLNILPNTFMWDDWQQIFENSLLRAPGGIVQIFNSNVWGFEGRYTNYYRPLMHLTFYGALRWFGFNPSGYHLISIFLHALCSALVLLLIRRWSQVASGVSASSEGGDSLTPLFAALLFAAHPVHTENVCWISAYPDLQATAFILLAALIYSSYESRQASDNASRWLRATGLGVCSFLGLLAKETAVVIPIICLAWELFQRRDIASTARTVVRERWTEYAGMACGTSAYLALRVHALGGLMPYVPRVSPPASDLFLTRIALFYRYWEKLVLPVNLSAFSDFPLSRSLWDWHVLAGIAALALFTWLLIWLWKRRHPVAMGMVVFAAALAPAFWLPFGGFNLLAERYLYLPSVGFCWLVGWRLAKMTRRIGVRNGALLLAAFLTAYGLRTEARNLDWRSEIPFYQKSIAGSPNIAELHVMLGEAYLRHEMVPQALLETNIAVAMKPDYMEAANNLGQIYSMMNKPAEAAAQYSLAIADAEKEGAGVAVARGYNNLAYETNRLGKTADAISLYRKAIRINPEFSGAYNNLGYLLLEQGRYQEAEVELRRALELEPTFPQAASNLGLLYLRAGNLDSALRYFNEALRLEPRSGETYARLGELAVARGNALEAKQLFRHALELHPTNQRAADGLEALRRQEK
jgi:protein O-mannosyl-transferase